MEVFDLGQHFLDIVAVGLMIVVPVASYVGVRLQEEPKSVVVLTGNSQHNSINLELGSLSSAWSDEELRLESSPLSPDESVLDTQIKINSFEGECSHISEGVSCGLEALEVGLEGDGRRGIDSNQGLGAEDESSDG